MGEILKNCCLNALQLMLPFPAINGVLADCVRNSWKSCNSNMLKLGSQIVLLQYRHWIYWSMWVTRWLLLRTAAITSSVYFPGLQWFPMPNKKLDFPSSSSFTKKKSNSQNQKAQWLKLQENGTVLIITTYMTTFPSCELLGGLFCVSLGSITLLCAHFTSFHLLWKIQIHALLHHQADKKRPWF